MSLVSLDDFEAAAKLRIEAGAWIYIGDGCGENLTLKANRAAFNRFFLVRRVLVDVSRRSMVLQLLGLTLPMPVVVAPTAANMLAHADGEVGVARACKRLGVIQTLSTFASKSVEEVCAVGHSVWFQLYVFKDRALSRQLVQRAIRAGVKAFVLTVDVPVFGLRENLDRAKFESPPHVRMANLLDAPPNLIASLTDLIDPSLSWKDIEWLRAQTSLPIILKGVMSASDAKLAVAHGADAIIVSNHGARQLDGELPTILALEAVARAVAKRIPVLVDGGFRRGTHILTALALGADAVQVGRPVIHGLAVDGEAGVVAVLDRLKVELDNVMAQTGVLSVRDVPRDIVVDAQTPKL
jgi:isopentenyl diphosphate isomerase/L-lactate dehydrogenase-like FMN-dependent dehydrogenase